MYDWKLEDLGWAVRMAISADRQTLLRVGFERGDRSAYIGIWSLHLNKLAKSLGAGRAVKVAKEICRANDVRAVTFAVHSTNGPCRRLAERKFGREYGVQPQGAWDAYLGCYVDAHYFQVLIAGIDAPTVTRASEPYPDTNARGG